MNKQTLNERTVIMTATATTGATTAAPTTATAHPTESTTDSTTADRVAAVVLTRLEDAWNAADGAAFGAAYRPDASFVTVQGLHIEGAEAIGAGHAGIFATIYAGSVNAMQLVSARELADGVVLAVSRHTLQVPAGPLAGTHQAMSTSVLVRDLDGWRVAATHNTLIGADMSTVTTAPATPSAATPSAPAR
jgi:uncharacterized protein (TIGR02246 family)